MVSHQSLSQGELIYDDRQVRPGVMFSDADLLGVPVRVILSPCNLQENCIELVTRDKLIQEKVPCDEIIPRVKELIAQLLYV